MQAEELLFKVSQGDTNAFKQLYELFKGRVYNTCLSHLQSVEEAEEAVQDVFVEIHRNAAEYKAQSTVSTWVYRITVNKCIDRLRYRNRQKRFAVITGMFSKSTGALLHDTPEFMHPGIVYENRERAAKLFAAIRQLPENQQTAFILKQVEGLPQREVAEIMDMTEKAIESLLQRAKANLRRVLGDMYNETKD